MSPNSFPTLRMQLRTGFRHFAEVNHWGQYKDSTNLVGIGEDVVPCVGLDDGGFRFGRHRAKCLCAKSSRNPSNDHHSDVDVDGISWIIDQRDHDNPQTSETKRTSPSLVARLCRTTSSPTRMPNTTPRLTTTETDGHPRTPMLICSRPSFGSLSRPTPLPSISPSPVTRRTHGSARLRTVRGELPSQRKRHHCPQTRRSTRPESRRIGITPAQT